MVSRDLEEVDRTFDIILGDYCSFADVEDVVVWRIDYLEFNGVIVIVVECAP